MKRLALLLVLAALAPAQAKAADTCPTYNAPDELVLDSGTPQSAKLGTPFSANLQVTVAASNGCPITTQLSGIPVTFVAPSTGPSGTFAASGANAVLVGTDGQGGAGSTPFTANMLTGGYQVVASSPYGSVSFSLVNTAVGVPASVKAVAAAARKADVNARYAAPLQVQVLDANGNPVQGVGVSFSLGGSAGGAGGAAAAGASFVGGQAQVTAMTASNGVATSPAFSANDVPGKFKASATVDGLDTAVMFALDNLAGTSPRIKALVGRQKAAVGATYRHALKVKVLGGNRKPLQNATVTFSLGGAAEGAGGDAGAAAAGASFVGGSFQVTETTNTNGIAASPRFQANTTPGTFTASATVTGATGAATFALDNLAGKSPRIKALVGRQKAVVGATYRHVLKVEVLGGNGRPLQNAIVTFSLGGAAEGGGGNAGAAAAGASFVGGSAQATEATNANGIAASPQFAANSTPGTFTASATITGATGAATFALDNLAGGAPTISAATGADQSTVVNGRYGRPLEARVRDSHGKPEQGQTVTFTLGAAAAGGSGASTGAGASFAGGSAQATATTNANGLAVSPALLANGTAGAFTATASVAGTSRTASFRLKNRAGAAVTVTAGAGAIQSASVGARFAVPLAVMVTDKEGNAVAGVLVKFTAPGSGASGTFHASHTVGVRTNTDGIAVAPGFVANHQVGGYVVKATVAGASAAGFGLVNS
jgi:adhesin/invasin